MALTNKAYLEWTGSINETNFKNKSKKGFDLIAFSGKHIAHIRPYKKIKEGYVKYSWWISSDLTGGWAIYDVVTKRKMTSGKTTSIEEAKQQVERTLLILNIRRVSESLLHFQ